MNKLFTKIAGVALGLSLAIGVGVSASNNKKVVPARAEDEVFYTLTPASGSNNNYGSNCDVEVNGIIWNIAGNSQQLPWRIGGKSISDTDRAVYSKTAMGSAITKVELTVGAASSITVNSLNLIVGDDDFSPAVDTVTETFAANSTITFEPTSGTSWATGQYYKFVFNVTVSGSKNKFVEFSSAKFYREKSASSTYTVTYNANGATSGTVPTDSNTYSASSSTVTVLGNTGSLAKTGYTFNGWNTSNDGNGTHYNAGATFTISTNTTLFAEWTINQYTLAYDANGGTGTLPEGDTYDYGTKVDVGSGSGLSNGDLVFAGWNTAQDGSGENYNEGAKITIEGNTTLYAKWSEPAATLTRVESESELSIGDEIAIVSNGTGSKKALSTTQNDNNRGAINVTVSDEYTFDAIDGVQMITLGKSNNHWTFAVDGGYLYAASSSSNYLRTQETNNENGEWTITIDSGVASITAQGSNTRNQLKNNGDIFSCYASGQTAVSIYKVAEEEKAITNSKMTVGTVSASTGDTAWTLTGFAFEVLYEGDSEYTDVTAKTTFNVTEAVPTIEDDGTLLVTVTPTYKGVEYTAKAAQVNATLTFANAYTIDRIYSGSANDAFEVDGIYMGEVADGYIFMNGEYGILVYDKDKSSTLSVGGAYTIEGLLSIYKGLYELGNNDTKATITELPNGSRKSHIATPVTYTVVGDETADKANRKTSFSGVVTSMSSTAADANSTLAVNVGGNSIQVYVKAAVASSEVMAALEASKDNETSIIIEGYTSWYNSFQVNLTNVVIEDTAYTVYEFARSLLKLTSGTCNESYDGVTNNGAALESIWGTLSGASYYGKLTDERKNDLKTATADSAVVVPATDEQIDAMSDADALKAAMYRYDYCTAKYNLTEFIEGRTLTVHFDANLKANVEIDSTNVPFVLVIISLVSVTAIAGCIILRKKRHY